MANRPHPVPSAERRRALSALTAAAASVALGARAAAPFDLAQLMKMLAQAGSGDATFVERREVQMLDRTLMSSGRLHFEAPSTFVRETLRPREERLEVVGNRLTIEQGGRKRTMELDASPEAAVMVEAVRGTLTGNRGAIERHFETAVSGDAARWRLDLVPRDARLRGQIAALHVKGSGATVTEIDVQIADGDRSVMTITPITTITPTAPTASAPSARGGRRASGVR